MTKLTLILIILLPFVTIGGCLAYKLYSYRRARQQAWAEIEHFSGPCDLVVSLRASFEEMQDGSPSRKKYTIPGNQLSFEGETFELVAGDGSRVLSGEVRLWTNKNDEYEWVLQTAARNALRHLFSEMDQGRIKSSYKSLNTLEIKRSGDNELVGRFKGVQSTGGRYARAGRGVRVKVSVPVSPTIRFVRTPPPADKE